MSEQLFQIGIKALIQNNKDEIFMLHIPKWGHNPAHWDLPGGRMDPKETFLQTLKRELKEEIGVSYAGKPKQLMGILTNITIPVEDKLIPLVFMIYSVIIKDINKIKPSKDLKEDEFGWFPPKLAADLMAIKFSNDFRDLVRKM